MRLSDRAVRKSTVPPAAQGLRRRRRPVETPGILPGKCKMLIEGKSEMTASERRDRAERAGYRVWPSDWQDDAGNPGRSWVVTRPGGRDLEDNLGSEAAAWQAAHADMRARASARR